MDPFTLFADDHVPPCAALGETCNGRCETLALVYQVGRRLYLRIEDGLAVGSAASMLNITQPELFGILTGSLAYTTASALARAAELVGLSIDDPERVERCFQRARAPRVPSPDSVRSEA